MDRISKSSGRILEFYGRVLKVHRKIVESPTLSSRFGRKRGFCSKLEVLSPAQGMCSLAHRIYTLKTGTLHKLRLRFFRFRHRVFRVSRQGSESSLSEWEYVSPLVEACVEPVETRRRSPAIARPTGTLQIKVSLKICALNNNSDESVTFTCPAQYLKYGDTIIIHLGGMIYTYAIRVNLLINPNNTHWLTKHEKAAALYLVRRHDAVASAAFRAI